MLTQFASEKKAPVPGACSGWTSGLFLLTICLGLTACAVNAASSAPTVSPGSATPLLSDLKLTKADNGKNYEFYKGSTLQISLKGNPTTGYQWGLMPESVNDLVLKSDGDYGFASDNPALSGAGGTFVFNFMASNPGEATLVFGYRRSWEKEPPAQTFSIAVRVKDVR